MAKDLQSISWNNSNIYQNFNDPKITDDLGTIEKNINIINSEISKFESLVPQLESKTHEELIETIPLARRIYRIFLDTNILIYTLRSYSSMATSINSLDYAAKDLLNKAGQLSANLNKTAKPLQLFLLRAPKIYLENFLKSESVEEMEFSLLYAKKEEDHLLSVPEEVLLEGHSVDGLHAWGKLYTDLSGAMKVRMDGEEIGLAAASNILFQHDRTRRKAAYESINQSWKQNEISAAAILNSINGWRLENDKARSKKKELHYLDKSCHQQKISRQTLNTMIETTYENRHIGHRALKLMARELKVDKLGPWDILAPYPGQNKDTQLSFPEAMELIYSAFNKFNPEMAEFAKLMVSKRWIDATPTENRGSGAYCSGFANVREPRVFITYDGSMKNLITLAHEIGHAYHSWVMRDMKFGKTFYASTLAETASIFAETLVRDSILENAITTEEKKSILWQEIESAATLLINIPARYDFECRLSELRKSKSLSVPEFKKLNTDAWSHWYEDTLTEYNDMFWASKLHFSISHFGFYNYPYLFGYLFSLGIYAKKNEYGEKFKTLYIDILRDTGSMTAEDLIKKHFNQDISKKEYWQYSLKIVENSVNEFEKL